MALRRRVIGLAPPFAAVIAVAIALAPAAPARGQNARAFGGGGIIGGVGNLRGVGGDLPSNRVGQLGGLYSGYTGGGIPQTNYGRFTTEVSATRNLASYGPRSLANTSKYSFTNPETMLTSRRRSLGLSMGQASPSFLTRSEKLVAQLPPKLRRTGPLRQTPYREPDRAYSPAEILQERRNLLSARSSLGRLMLSNTGFGPPSRLIKGLENERISMSAQPQPAAPMMPPTQAPAPPMPGADAAVDTPAPAEAAPEAPHATSEAVNELLMTRLAAMYEKEMNLAIAAMHAGDRIKARSGFYACRSLAQGSYEPFLAGILVATELENYSRASFDLLIILNRSKSLDDLKTDVRRYYPDEQAFNNLVEKVNIAVGKAQMNPFGDQALVLAYLAFLKGDLGTAISAAQTAENQAVQVKMEQRKKTIQRFREMLTAARASS